MDPRNEKSIGMMMVYIIMGMFATLLGIGFGILNLVFMVTIILPVVIICYVGRALIWVMEQVILTKGFLLMWLFLMMVSVFWMVLGGL